MRCSTDLPKLVAKFSVVADKLSTLEDQGKKVVTNVGALADKVEENPSLLLKRSEKERPAGGYK